MSHLRSEDPICISLQSNISALGLQATTLVSRKALDIRYSWLVAIVRTSCAAKIVVVKVLNQKRVSVDLCLVPKQLGDLPLPSLN